MAPERDPNHTVEAERGRGHVIVRHDGRLLADSVDPVIVHETGLPDRYYLPEEDVALDYLEPSSSTSTCPYKGTADRYWSVRGDDAARDVAWSYSEPLPELALIAGRIAFYQVDVTFEEP